MCIAGDDVDKKKPDPEIYTLAAKRMGLDPATCICIEDSTIGLKVRLHCAGSFASTAAGCSVAHSWSNSARDLAGNSTVRFPGNHASGLLSLVSHQQPALAPVPQQLGAF